MSCRTINKLLNLHIIIILLTFLVACGGGGNDRTSSSVATPTPTPTPTSTPTPTPSPQIDRTPDNIIFIPAVGVELETSVVSNQVSINGINTSITISLSEGAYSINGGEFQTGPGMIMQGDNLVVQLSSSTEYSTERASVITLGESKFDFSVTTRSQDVSPDSFQLGSLQDIEPATLASSNSIAISGIEGDVSISVVGGEYSIDGGDFTSSTGFITNGQSIAVRLVSSPIFSESLELALTIGDTSESFSVTTRPQDTSPDSFRFNSVADVQPSTVILSNSVIVEGFDGSVSLTIVNGEYSIDGGEFTSIASEINSGQSLRLRHTSPSEIGADYVTSVTVGDLTRTFASATRGNSIPTWMELSEAPTKHAISSGISSIRDVAVADVDGDGDLDALSGSGFASVSWYENDGSSTPSFTFREIDSERSGTTSIISEDIDQDGDTDILSVFLTSISWFENDGAEEPTFTENTFSGNAGLWDIVIADIDEDDNLDIVTVSVTEDEITWHQHDGAINPSFTENTVGTTDEDPRRIVVVDLDGDGDLDVVSGSSISGTIFWYENDGAQTPSFTRLDIRTEVGAVYAISSGDFDGDQDIDIVYASSGNDNFIWLENNGEDNPSFSFNVIAGDFTRPTSVRVMDMENDGDPDIVYTDSFDDKVGWFENSGGQNPIFIDHILTEDSNFADANDVGDINGDGVIEVVSSGTFDDVSWYVHGQRQYQVQETQSLVVLENAEDLDDDTLHYGLIDGADSQHFSINEQTGELTFANAPAVSNPADANEDNVYITWIFVSDGFSSINRLVSVEVIE